MQKVYICMLLDKNGTCAETRFRLLPKRTSPFKSAGASVQSTAGSRGVRISISNAGYTTFWGSVRVLATHSIGQFPLHSPSHASPCAIRFQTHSTLQTHGRTYPFNLSLNVLSCFTCCTTYITWNIYKILKRNKMPRHTFCCQYFDHSLM